jgi:Carbohydrate binding module (family 35)/3-keto-disaccharide hydrolase
MRKRIGAAGAGILVLGLLLPVQTAHAAPARYEAENAVISQGVVEANHLNFSGTGFVNADNVVGSYVEWTVNAPNAGTATLTIRYSNGTTAARPADVAVNGTVVAAALSFGTTPNWDTWANKVVTAQVNAGANTVRVTGTTASGPANLDYLDLEVPATITAYQAETAVLSQAAVASNHTGFTGTGFVDYTNVASGYIEWTVGAASAGTQTLILRYANGTTASRPLTISVNGTAVATNVAFNPTANWDTWADKALTASLIPGSNVVRATATGSSGGPNIDKLSVTGTGDPTPPTPPGTPTQVSITSTSVTVSWTPGSDNVGVAGYDIFADGRLCGTVPGSMLTGTCTGLTPDTDAGVYLFSRDAAGNVSGSSGTLTVHTPPGSSNPYGDPNLVSMFNGATLDGWTSSRAGLWSAQNGVIHGNGTARGWLFFNHQVGTFRWIFTVRQVSGDHAPTVLIWGTTQQPYLDALGAIQFQPPNGGHWDYRPGHNNGGGTLFTSYPHPKWDIHNWSQCELIGNHLTGIARMACCPLSGTQVKCVATEVLKFSDRTAGRVGPLAIQIHNSGIHDEYKNLYYESPVVTNPDGFITTS